MKVYNMGQYYLTGATTKIVVRGIRHFGIPTAALFSDIDGFTVVGIQRRSKRSGWKIDRLNK